LFGGGAGFAGPAVDGADVGGDVGDPADDFADRLDGSDTFIAAFRSGALA
jgi:hypothetical protein